ncbi:MAG: hypothetical protein ACI8WB_005060, partial [Phenylobacterium sp.]
MRYLSIVFCWLVMIGVASASASAGVSASEMSPQQRRGQQIYLTGQSPSGESIQARLND